MKLSEKLDWQLLSPVIFLISVGLIILLSASMPYAERMWSNPYYLFQKQTFSLILALCTGCLCFYIKPIWWQRWRHSMIFIAILMLIMVLVPGVGRTVKGASRWLSAGFMQLQVAEFVKLSVFVYIAGFINQHHDDLRWNFQGFIKPLIVLSLLSSLLILEPDFGSVCVIITVSLGQMFVSGARLRYMMLLAFGVSLILMLVIWTSPYRLERMLAFFDPWHVADKSGYQMIHAMMAVKAGGIWGVGLGESIEKWFYLPEAHNDFLLAILIEECGLIALIAVLVSYGLIFSRMLVVSYTQIQKSNMFNGSFVMGVALWWVIQALVNISVNMALIPTKGITLPMVSYGGSSLIAFAASLGIVLRIVASEVKV